MPDFKRIPPTARGMAVLPLHLFQVQDPRRDLCSNAWIHVLIYVSIFVLAFSIDHYVCQRKDNSGRRDDWLCFNPIYSVANSINSTNQTRESEGVAATSKARTVMADLAVSESGARPMPHVPMFPYAPAEVLHALKRQYHVATIAWTPAKVLGDLLGTVDFPDALFNIPFIMKELKGFEQYRADVEIEIRVQSTKFEYGMAMCLMQPAISDAFWLPYFANNVYGRSQLSPVLLSAQKANPVKLSLGWTPLTAFDPITNYNPARIGRMEIVCLNPLQTTSVDVPTDLRITVYANFKNIELNILNPASTGPMPLALRKIRAESDPISTESIAKEASGVIAGVKEAVKTAESIIGLVPGVAEIARPLLSMFGFNKPTSLTSAIINQPEMARDLQFTKGLSYVSKLSSDPECSISAEKGICGPENPQMTIYDLAKMPTLVAAGSWRNTAQVLNTPLALYDLDPCSCPLVTASTYQLTFLAMAMSNFRYWRGGMKIKMYLSMSGFMSQRIFIAHCPDGTIPASIDNISGDMPGKIVDLAGDTEIEIYIPFQAQSHARSVLNPHAAAGANRLGHLVVYALTYIQSPTEAADPPVLYTIWAAAAEDMRFVNYTAGYVDTSDHVHRTLPASFDVKVRPKKEKKIRAECSVWQDFKKPFEGIVPGVQYHHESRYICGEDYGAIVSLLHRPSSIPVVVGDNGIAAGPQTVRDAVGTGLSTADCNSATLCSAFRFWRGSTRIFMFDSASSTFVSLNNQYLTRANYQTYGDYMRCCLLPQKGSIASRYFSVECPYFYTDPIREFEKGFQDPDQATHPDFGFNAAFAATNFIGWAAGDDFSLGTLRNCPLYSA